MTDFLGTINESYKTQKLQASKPIFDGAANDRFFEGVKKMEPMGNPLYTKTILRKHHFQSTVFYHIICSWIIPPASATSIMLSPLPLKAFVYLTKLRPSGLPPY